MNKPSPAAIAMIVDFEVTSQAVFTAKYQGPTWPGGMSGVTFGIGYDCGYSTVAEIRADWDAYLPAPMVEHMAGCAGIHGPPASSHAYALHGLVTVPWAAAMAVFTNRDMPKWSGIVTAALLNTDLLSEDSFGARSEERR